MEASLLYQIYAIVEEIPIGKVATYQLIAELCSHPKNCRLVGRALKYADQYGSFPCHRVVHSDGSLVQGWEDQFDLLKNEGVEFTSSNKVKLISCLWQINKKPDD